MTEREAQRQHIVNYTDAQPLGDVNGTSSPTDECETEPREFESHENSSRNCSP